MSNWNSLHFFFLKWRQKICLNLLIKKKRIAQLINGKPGENQYNKTTREQHQNLQPSNQQAHPTYDRELTTSRAPQHKEDSHNRQPTEGSSLNQLSNIFLLRISSSFCPK
jgi:hypothetical protein